MTANATHWIFTPLQELLACSQSWKNENIPVFKNPLLPTPASTDPKERSEMYACGKCPFTGRRDACEKHFIIHHMDEENVPWMCSLCGFRCRTEHALDTHMTLDIHKRALARKPDEHTSFIKAKDPHKIEIGKDIFLSTEDRPYYFSQANRFESRNTHRPIYSFGEYENTEDIRHNDRSRRRYQKRKDVNSSECYKDLNGNDLKRSRDIFETGDRPVEHNDFVLIDDFNLGEVHSTTNAGAEEDKSEDLLGKLIDDMHSTDTNIGLAPRKHKNDMNERLETEYEIGTCNARNFLSRPSTPQSSPREETSSRNGACSKSSTPKMAKSIEDPSPSKSIQETHNISTDFRDLDDNADLDIDQDLDTDDENLGDKINEIIHVLEPLKNISKALIAIDHHFRRVLPLLEALVPNVPQAATPTKGQDCMAAGRCPEESGDLSGYVAQEISHFSGSPGRNHAFTGQYNHASGHNSAAIFNNKEVVDQRTWITGQVPAQDIGSTGQDTGSNKQCSVDTGQGARSLRQGLWGQTEFVPLGQFSTVTGQPFSKRPKINRDPRTKRN